MKLEEAIIEALRPRDVGERIRFAITGGLSARQVLYRLPPAIREELLAGDGDPTQRQRDAQSKVVEALFHQIDRGRVQRRRTRIRTSMVDAYRLA